MVSGDITLYYGTEISEETAKTAIQYIDSIITTPNYRVIKHTNTYLLERSDEDDLSLAIVHNIQGKTIRERDIYFQNVCFGLSQKISTNINCSIVNQDFEVIRRLDSSNSFHIVGGFELDFGGVVLVHWPMKLEKGMEIYRTFEQLDSYIYESNNDLPIEIYSTPGSLVIDIPFNIEKQISTEAIANIIRTLNTSEKTNTVIRLIKNDNEIVNEYSI